MPCHIKCEWDDEKVTEKQLMQTMTFSLVPEPNDYTAMIDMGLIWRLATPTKEQREKIDGSRYVWGEYAQHLIHLIISRHEQARK